MTFIKIYAIAIVIFMAIDSIWLLYIAKDLYQKEIGHLLANNPNLIAALIFYLIFLFGLVYFVIEPNIDKNVINIIVPSLLFGLITYATYDLTNLATLEKWPIKITIIDLIWGSFISMIVSILTHVVYNLIK